MSLTPLIRRDSAPETESFQEWAEPVIADLKTLVDELRAEVSTLRRQVGRLQQGAGRGLSHPSDVGDTWI